MRQIRLDRSTAALVLATASIVRAAEPGPIVVTLRANSADKKRLKKGKKVKVKIKITFKADSGGSATLPITATLKLKKKKKKKKKS